MRTIIIIATIIMLILTGCSPNNNTMEDNKMKTISIDEANTLIETQNPTIIDIRTPEEYNAGHLKGAINIDFYEDNFLEEMKQAPQDKPILIYCRSGGRSGSAMNILEGELNTTVYEIEGGTLNWQRNGQEMVK